jgi:isoamylase
MDERGNPIADDTLLILVNAHHEAIAFVLPTHNTEHRWECLLDTQEATGHPQAAQIDQDMPYDLDARSLALFHMVKIPEAEA